MFLFTWMFGLAFWVLYITCGLFFCVVFIRKIAPNVFKVLIGKGRKCTYGYSVGGKFTESTHYCEEYKGKKGFWPGERSVSKEDIFGVVLASLVFWPVTALICIIVLIFNIALSLTSKVFILLFKALNKLIPEIEIKVNKDKKEKM